jgi:hypothetical protein
VIYAETCEGGYDGLNMELGWAKEKRRTLVEKPLEKTKLG